MRNLVWFCLLAGCVFLCGCSTTILDKEATIQNDANMQSITEQNENSNAILFKDGKINSLLQQSRHEQNESAKKLARKMLRAANKDMKDLDKLYPDIP